MVSVRKRNIQGRYNIVRHLQRRYLELPPQLLQVQFRYRLKITKHQNKTQVIHLKAICLHQAESDQSRTGIIIT